MGLECLDLRIIPLPRRARWPVKADQPPGYGTGCVGIGRAMVPPTHTLRFARRLLALHLSLMLKRSPSLSTFCSLGSCHVRSSPFNLRAWQEEVCVLRQRVKLGDHRRVDLLLGPSWSSFLSSDVFVFEALMRRLEAPQFCDGPHVRSPLIRDACDLVSNQAVGWRTRGVLCFLLSSRQRFRAC